MIKNEEQYKAQKHQCEFLVKSINECKQKFIRNRDLEAKTNYGIFKGQLSVIKKEIKEYEKSWPSVKLGNIDLEYKVYFKREGDFFYKFDSVFDGISIEDLIDRFNNIIKPSFDGGSHCEFNDVKTRKGKIIVEIDSVAAGDSTSAMNGRFRTKTYYKIVPKLKLK